MSVFLIIEQQGFMDCEGSIDVQEWVVEIRSTRASAEARVQELGGQHLTVREMEVLE